MASLDFVGFREFYTGFVVQLTQKEKGKVVAHRDQLYPWVVIHRVIPGKACYREC